VFRDERGFFMKAGMRGRFADATGLNMQFVQDNHSRSVKKFCAAFITKSSGRRANWFG